MVYCAVRGGEIFRLEWQDINIESGKIILRDTKNTETRIVYMSKAVKKMLIRRRDNDKIKKKKKTDWNPLNLIFPGRSGKRITSISRTFDRVVEDLGLNEGITDKRYRFTFHCIRHTAASWLVQAGTPLYTVQQLLGHKTAALTARYSHLAPANMQQTAKFFDKLAETDGAEVIPMNSK